MGVEAILGYHLGLLLSYTEAWVKLAFRDLPITGFGDFGVLKFIEQARQPTKNAVAESMVMEPSTCFEILKRLQKKGLIKESPDPHDKRAKRVSLTDQGKP